MFDFFLKRSPEVLANTKEFGNQIKDLYDSGQLAQSSISKIADGIGEVSSSAVVAAEKLKTGKIEIGEFVDIANKGGSSLGIFANAIKNIGMNMLIMAAVSAAFWAVGQVIDNVVHKTEKLKKASEEASKSIQEVKDTYAEHIKLLKEVSESYNDLASGVNTKTNQNLTLSSDDYNKFLDINNQLAKSFPQLVDTIDDNGNAIINLGNNSQESAAKIRELLQAEQDVQNYKIFQNIDDLYGGVKVQFEEAKKAAEDYETVINSTKDSLAQVKDLSESGITIGDKIEFSGSYGNSVDFEKLQSYKNVVQEFYNSLDKDRQIALNIDGSFLPSTMIKQNAQDDSKFDFYLNTVLLTDDEKEKLQNMIQSEVGALWSSVTESFEDLKTDKTVAQQNAELAWKDFLPNLVSAMKSRNTYKELDDASKSIAETLVSGLSWDDVDASGLGPYDYVRRNIILPLTNLPASDKYAAEKTYHDLFALKDEDLSPTDAKEKIDAYIDQLAEYLNIDSAKLKIQLGFGSADDLASKYQQTLLSTVNQFKGDEGTRDWDKWFKYAGINTDEEIDNWNKIAKSCKTAVEAKKQYLNETSGFSDPLSKEDMISEINGLSEGFEELDKIMTSMKDTDKKFDYSLLDDKKFKDNFSGLTEEYNAFMDAVTNSPKDVAACQSAFDNLASAFVYNSKVIKGLSDDNADVAAQYLELMGIQNAEEVVTSALAQRHAEAAWEARDLSNATYEEIVAIAQEGESTASGQKAFELYLAQKILANQNPYDASTSIGNLKAIVGALGIASNAWTRYYAAMNRMKEIDADPNYVGYEEDGSVVSKATVIQQYADIAAQAQEELKGEIDAQLKEVQVSNYTGPKSTNPQKNSGSKNSDAKDPTQFDWIERKITLIDKQVDRLKTKIDTLVGYKNKNAATDTVIDLLNDKLTTLQKSTERYQEELSKIDIPQEYIDKIQNGGFDVDIIAPSDEALAKKIKNYQDLYDKMVDCNDQITETTASIKELNLSKLDNIIDQYSKMSDIQSQILDTEKSLLDLREKQGDKIFASDYTPLIERQLSLSKEYADAYSALAAEMSKMNLKVGTDEWKKYNDQLQDYKNNMISAASAVEDYKDTMTELVYKELTDFKSQMDSLNNSISTMTDLIGSTDLVDDAGNLTDRGIAQVALYAKQLANAKQEAAEYAEAIKSLDDALSSGLITQDEYNSMVSEYTSAQESAVKANKEARDSILSLVKDGIQAEIDAKKELIDQTKAALEAEQDLHEYQESIAEKSSNIAKLERQIAALSNSTDRADIAKKLQLQQDLAEAQKDLYDTQYDHEMEQRKQALDDEYDAFEESKNKESDELDTNLDKQNAAIKDYLDKVKANYSTAYDVLQQYGDEYSLAAIDSLTEPWDSSSEAANVCADAIGDVTANIQYEIDSLDFSSLYELVDLLNQIGAGTYSGSGSYGGDFEDITGTGKWQQGKGGRWWYGEDYNENGDYDYASGGIYTIKGKQYGFDDEGYMITGWNDDSGEWRYFEPENGEMVRDSWRESNGKWYYLGSDGAMARDTTVKAMDGSGYYYIGDDGAWDGKDADAMDNLFYQKLKGKKVGYRNGTQNATPGWHEVNEDGREVLITNDGMLMKMEPGDGVFTKEQTDRLFEILSDPSVMTRGITAFNMKPNTDYAPAPVSQSIEVNMNVGGVVDEAALRVLNEQFPAMIKNNRKLITDQVGKGVKWQLKGK